MKYRIMVNKQDRERLIEKFGVSHATISYVLNFKRFNDLHSEIRNYAMNHLNGILLRNGS